MLAPHRSSDTANHVLHPRYRPDIDGLRAVAVLAVLLFHAFPALLPGGFVGVDVFFVISGYLISTIIFENLRNGSFSFRDYYGRRIRRIFPALTLVLSFGLALGWFVLLAQEYAQLGKHVAAGAGFVSNFTLWSESGYFDTASSAKPLLHLWSLAIEEQFYIAWPALVWLAWRTRRSLLAVTLTLLLLSFSVNVLTVGGDPVAAYYSPLGRFWELLAGAWLAYRAFAGPGKPACACPNLQATIGLVLLVGAVTRLDPQALFPGWWAVLPVAGAALLIAAGESAWVNRYLLSNRIMVGVGLISYPLYLWHWPLLSFAEIMVGRTPEAAVRAGLLLMAFGLAWLTYRLVERPCRTRRWGSRRVFYLAGLMAALGMLGINVMVRDGLPLRYEQLSAAKEPGARSAGFTSLGTRIGRASSDPSCEELVPRTTSRRDLFCHLSDPRPYLGVIGDSHAEHLFFGLSASDSDRLNRVLVVGSGGCHPASRGGQTDNCDDQSQANLAMIERYASLKYVVLAANSRAIEVANQKQYKALMDGYLETALRLQRMGKIVIFVIDTPDFLVSPVSCAANPLPLRNLSGSGQGACETLPVASTKPRSRYSAFVSELQQRTKGLVFLDAYAAFCDAKACRVIDDGALVFRDINHLTDYGSKLVADRLRAIVN